MDEITKFILNSRSKGASDDQIKQTLASNHWTPDQIQNAFLAINNVNTQQSARRKNVLIIITAIVLLGGITAGLFFIIPQVTPQSSTRSLTTPVASPLPSSSLPTVAYLKIVPSSSEKYATSSGILTLYDFTSRQSFSPSLPEKQTADFLPLISPWSPSGQYLFLLGIREHSLPQPLFVYDNIKRTLTYLLDTNEVPELKGVYSVFNFSSQWVDDQTLAFPELGPLTERKATGVSIDGKLSSLTLSGDSIQYSNRLKITGLFKDPSTNQTRVYLDGKELPPLLGTVVGVTDKYIVTLQKPEFTDPMKDPVIQQKLSGEPNEETGEKILEEAYKPTGESIIYLYSINNPDAFTSFTLPTEGWTIAEAQTLSTKNSLVLHEQDSLLFVNSSRFTLISLDDPSHLKKVISEVNSPIAVQIPEINDESDMNITPDEQWLVVQKLNKTDPFQIAGAISAWNIDSGEAITICEDSCSSLRVYNPTRLRLKFEKSSQ